MKVMKVGDIVVFNRSRNKGKAMGKVGNIDGKNIIVLNIVDSNLSKLSGFLGSGNSVVSYDSIVNVINI